MPDPTMPDPMILDYYAERYEERARLGRAMGRLERLRTADILARVLPAAPAVVLDVGGGPGAYAVPLAQQGYAVHLVDLVPRHVAQATEAAEAMGVSLASARVGDAAALPFDDGVADAVLLLGPLYHTQEEEARVAVFREAARVARPGAWVVAAGISRYASALDGMLQELLMDPVFVEIVAADLESGRHMNPTADPRYFTTAYFHEPGQLEAEARAAGLTPVSTLAVEGPASLLGDVEARLDDPDRAALLMSVLRRLEAVPALLGASWHHLALARAPEGR